MAEFSNLHILFNPARLLDILYGHSRGPDVWDWIFPFCDFIKKLGSGLHNLLNADEIGSDPDTDMKEFIKIHMLIKMKTLVETQRREITYEREAVRNPVDS